MATTTPKNLQILMSQPRYVFLLDGLGALLSALLLVFLIAPFESVFGMPTKTAYNLAFPAFGLMAYSLICSALNPAPWQPLMRIIALLNALYCCITLGFVITQFAALTMLGVAYFLGEIAIVAGVITLEILTVRGQKQI